MTSIGAVRLASLAPDGRRLAYVRTDGVRESLWLRPGGEADHVQLVAPRDGTFRSLTFGPNDFVYFTFFQPDQTPVGLYRVSVRGGEPEAIAPATGGISFSPDGLRYAYVSNMSVALGESRIVVVTMDSGSGRVLAIRRPPESFLRTPPAWSPDGSRLGVFGVSDQNPAMFALVTIGVGDGQILAAAPLTLGSVERALWMPDASGFVVSASETRASPQRLWHVSARSGAVQPLTHDLSDYSLAGLTPDGPSVVAVRGEVARSIWAADVDDLDGARQIALDSGSLSGFEGLAWTPDYQLLYASAESGTADIWSLDPDGGARRRLTDDPADDFHPAVSADGQTVVFASNRSGTPGLWAMSRDGTNVRRLTTGADSRPAISPEGRSVVFERIGVDTTPFALWRVPVDGGPAVCIGTLHSMRPAISSDGQSIAHYWMTPEKWMLAITREAADLPAQSWPIRPTHLDRIIRWSADGTAIAFLDRHGGASNIWLQKLTERSPARLTHFTQGVISTFDLSRDGSRLAWTRITEVRDVVTFVVDVPSRDR